MSRSIEDTLSQAGAKLLIGGSIASAIVSLALGAITWLALSQRIGIACLVGAAIGLAAMALSQAGLTAMAKLPPQMILVLALGVYAVAFLLLLGCLSLVRDHTSLAVLWVVVGVGTSVAAYVLGLALTYPRLRLLLFSSQSSPATSDPDPSHESEQ